MVLHVRSLNITKNVMVSWSQLEDSARVWRYSQETILILFKLC